MSEERYDVTEEPAEKSGLTTRSFLAMLYAAIVFEPAIMWMSLMTWGVLGGAVSWCTLLLFTEIARFFGKPLTQQESTIIFMGAGISGQVFFSLWLLYCGYYVHSPAAKSFGLTDLVPTFYAAPAGSESYILRQFYHPDWWFPILVLLFYQLFYVMTDLSLALIFRQIYVEAEELPFPMSVVTASAIKTMTIERETKRTRFLYLGAIVGIIYSTVVYTIPNVVRAYGYTFELIPIPWFDLSPQIQKVLPGAAFGIATDITLLAVSFVLPVRVIISLFIGSVIVYLVGNPLLVHLQISTFAKEYVPNMSLNLVWYRSLLFYWTMPMIGIGIAAGIVPAIMHRREFAEAIRSLRSTAARKAKYPLWMLLSVFLAAMVGATIMVYILVPDFPWLFTLIVPTAWNFLFILVSARVLGVSGVGFSIPNFPNLAILATGYEGTSAWFSSQNAMIWEYGGAAGGADTWVANFKVAKLCNCTPTSLLKAWLLAMPPAIIMGFLYVSSFWAANPLPSPLFPATTIQWPIQATIQSIWIKRTNPDIFRPMDIVYSSVIFFFIYLVCEIVHAPISIPGLLGGLASPIAMSTTYLIGGLIAAVLRRALGGVAYEEYKSVLSAGLVLGTGIMIVLGAAIALVIRSVWVLPY